MQALIMKLCLPIVIISLDVNHYRIGVLYRLLFDFNDYRTLVFQGISIWYLFLMRQLDNLTLG